MQNNAYAQYKNQSLSTMAPGELLVKLFDELMKQCRLGIIHIEKRDLAAANDNLMKAQTIVSTLDSSLDTRYPLAGELRNFYVFFAQQLFKANMEKNGNILEELLPLIKELRDSFDQAEKLSRRTQHEVGVKAV